MIERLHLLDSVFAMDLCTYAVMSNHIHLVLRVDIAQAKAWDGVKFLRLVVLVWGLWS